MARDESDREDLLREATALVERIEVAPSGGDSNDGERVVAGFLRDGAMSIYFGSEPAYHFNSAGELRRAYCSGLLVNAEAGRLVSMERRRAEHEVHLLRHELSDTQQVAFIKNMSDRLRAFEEECRSNHFATIGQVPVHPEVLPRVLAFLAEHQEVTIAKSPRL